MVSPTVAWGSGKKGTYARTTSGGKTWTVGTVAGAEKLDFRAVKAFGASTAYLLSAGPGDASRIYKTSDGGKTWIPLERRLPYRSAVAWAKDRWIAVGTSGSHVSQDDGDTWKLLDRGHYNSVGFTASGEGWAVGPNGNIAKFVRE